MSPRKRRIDDICHASDRKPVEVSVYEVPMSTKDLVSILKEHRRRHDLRQSDVGDKIGLSASEVSRIENGRRRFPLHLVDQWAEALGLRIDVAVSVDEQAGVHVRSAPPQAVQV